MWMLKRFSLDIELHCDLDSFNNELSRDFFILFKTARIF